MAHVERTAEVAWSGTIARGLGMASGGSGAIRGLPITLASRFGAPEGKTSPEELIAAAHAGCFAMALGSVLAGRGTPPERLRRFRPSDGGNVRDPQDHVERPRRSWRGSAFRSDRVRPGLP
jgi:hypothetical protein